MHKEQARARESGVRTGNLLRILRVLLETLLNEVCSIYGQLDSVGKHVTCKLHAYDDHPSLHANLDD
jgi:hypothetical protein